jgi:carboxypeptidase D
MYGLFTELGPLHVSLGPDGRNLVMKQNPYSWHNLTDIFFVDQPVGTGYSTAESNGYIADEDEMGRDFVSISLSTYVWSSFVMFLTPP